MNHRGTSIKQRKAIGERLALAIASHHEYKNWNQGQLALLMGVKAQSISLWMRAERLPSVEHCIAWSEVLKISLDWLLLGKGEMRLRQPAKGEAVDISEWPQHAKDVVRGMAIMFDKD